MKDPMALIEVASHVHALVAGNSAQRLEELVAGVLLAGNRSAVAPEPAIEAAAGRQERALVGGDSVQQVGPIRPPAVGLAELPHDRGVRAQPSENLIGRRSEEHTSE